MEFFNRHREWVYSFAVAVILVSVYSLAFAPPSDFPSGDIVVISRGASVSDIATELARAHIVRHASVLSLTLRISGAGSRVKSGAYLFKTPQNVFSIASRLIAGAYGLPPIRATFPEGVTVRDVAAKVTEVFPTISTQDFIAAGKSEEGYLFPDTYLFPLDATADSIVKTMRANFDTKLAPLTSDIKASGHSIADIITMASLIEKEARTDLNRRLVAGVLWNRLSLGMPLQVDAVFGYIYNRDTYSPSYADLKVDSPYNTYLHTGLPPGPICNPGLEAIDAVLHPTKTGYLYYLTDKNGVMHYATTYAAHMANQQKYLH